MLYEPEVCWTEPGLKFTPSCSYQVDFTEWTEDIKHVYTQLHAVHNLLTGGKQSAE